MHPMLRIGIDAIQASKLSRGCPPPSVWQGPMRSQLQRRCHRLDDRVLTFASGRARLETRPVLMTSPMPPSTIGIVVVARLAAKAAGVPQVTIKSTGNEPGAVSKAE